MDYNVLINDDCFNVFNEIEDKSIDMIFCDLPYGVTARNKWDTPLPLNSYIELNGKFLYKDDFLSYCYKIDIPYKKAIENWNLNKKEGLWDFYNRIIKDNGVIILTATEPFATSLINSNKKYFRYDLVWEKTTSTGFLNANKMPLRSHERILVFYKKLPIYNPQKTYGHKRKVSTAEHKKNSKMTLNYRDYNYTSYDSTERFPKSVIIFPTDKQKEALHPTQKPINLIKWLVRSYSSPNSVILDNCSGSGTTALAVLSVGEGRKFICIEKDEDIFELSYDRLLKYINIDFNI